MDKCKICTSNIDCSLCMPGYYLFIDKNGAYSCISLPCQDGMYGDVNSQKCEKCPKGKFNKKDMFTPNDCHECNKGTYADQDGQSLCTNCPSGTELNKMGSFYSNDCTLCAAGSYSLGAQATCTKCIEGEYQNEQGKNTCYRKKDYF